MKKKIKTINLPATLVIAFTILIATYAFAFALMYKPAQVATPPTLNDTIRMQIDSIKTNLKVLMDVQK